MDPSHLNNLDAMIAGVAAHPAYLFDLTCLADGDGPDTRYCTAGLLATLPHFVRLGVVRHARSGAGRLPGRDADETLLDLFGRYAGADAGPVLCARYGEGRWDRTLTGWFPVAPGHRQLALARLYHAREIALGNVPGGPPGRVPPAALQGQLGLPAERSVDAYHRANLGALLAAVRALQVELRPVGRGPEHADLDGRGDATLAGLVGRIAHFQVFGVHPDSNGWPTMQFANDGMLGVCETLDLLFGAFAGEPASTVLFGAAGNANASVLAWHALTRTALPPDAGENQLTIARLCRALDLVDAPAPPAAANEAAVSA